jgi:hypothetical protein
MRIFVIVGQGGRPGRAGDKSGKCVWPSYARLAKRDMTLEAAKEARPISPNIG